MFPHPRLNLVSPPFASPKWSGPNIPTEDFSFFPCRLEDSKFFRYGLYLLASSFDKTGFYQPANVLEMIAPHMPTVKYGAKFNLLALYNSITFYLLLKLLEICQNRAFSLFLVFKKFSQYRGAFVTDGKFKFCYPLEYRRSRIQLPEMVERTKFFG